MKLKLVMSNAETGEVLHEETNLDFAMMAYGRKIEEGVGMACRTEAHDVTTLAYASFLCGVENSVKKAVCENKMEEAYTLTTTGTEHEAGELEKAKLTTLRLAKKSCVLKPARCLPLRTKRQDEQA